MGRPLGDYDQTWLKRQTLGSLFFKGLGLFIVAGLVLGIVGLGAGWFKAGTDIISPDNVKSQWQFAYDTEAALDAIGSQWCTAKKAEDAALTNDERLQRSSQRIAVEQNYDRVAATYNGRLADVFRAKLVKPSDVPDRAPTLTQVVERIRCLA